MTKNIILLFATLGLVFVGIGCTSQKTEDGSQVVENANGEKIEAESLDTTTTAQATDPALDAALNETTTTTTTTEAPVVDAQLAPTISDSSVTTITETAVTTVDAAPPAMATETTAALTETPITATAITDSATTVVAETNTSAELTETPITDESVVQASVTETETKVVAPMTSMKSSSGGGGSMKKVSATVPYQGKYGGWINTIYIARPSEKLSDISMKIFGSDREADLKKISENSFLKSRSAKAGDKIYYSSPNRPDDSAKMMLYYEDMGMVPDTYVAKKGESLRKISKELLGYDNAWKEVWVSNSVESKTSLKDGETLRYWKTADASMAVAAQPAPAQGATLIDASQAAANAAAALPAPPTDAAASLPPPPDAAPPAVEAAPADTASLPPPPPPPDVAPPPPEEVVAAAADDSAKPKVNLDEAAAAEEDEGAMDSNTMMSMGALGVLVAALAFVIIKKKKQKVASEMAANEMNV